MKRSTKVDGRPSIQFYHRDARNDMALKLCSLSARGLWYEALWIMYDSPERGVLLEANGSRLEAEPLAKLVAAPIAEVKQDLTELKAREVYSTREDDAIYNRRMVRDEKLRLSKVEAGRKGGKRSKRKAEPKAKRRSSSSTSSKVSRTQAEFVAPNPSDLRAHVIENLRDCFGEDWETMGEKVREQRIEIQMGDQYIGPDKEQGQRPTKSKAPIKEDANEKP